MASADNRPAVIEERLLLDCVHCGFCLEACPTYQLTRTEMDSPRGRIYAIKSLTQGRLALDNQVVAHLDFCLGCRGCETACPSGVHYGALIEQARAYIEDRYRRPPSQRLRRWLVNQLFPYPRRLNLLLAPLRLIQWLGLRPVVEKMLPARPREWLELLPDLGRPSVTASVPVPADPRATVAIHPGCVARVLADSPNRSAAELLQRTGYQSLRLERAPCCGALDLHNGNLRRARAFARATIAQFQQSGADRIISTASGCSTAMAEYGELLRDDPAWAGPAKDFSAKVSELSRLLAQAQPAWPTAFAASVTYHDACHLAHGLGIRQEPRALLRAVAGLKLVEMEQSDLCCGSAGSYNLTQPEAAMALARRKVDAIEKTGARYVVLANPGCQFQIAAELKRRGSSIEVLHLADLLAVASRPAPTA